jgi:hypothetical protein
MEIERRLRELEEGPTLGRYGTPMRPLNGFALQGGGTDKFKEHCGGGGLLVRRPPVRRSLSALAPRELSTPSIANSHYAKAVRLLLLSFDDTADCGTALPHPVVGGEYTNDGNRGGGRRGDTFIRP